MEVEVDKLPSKLAYVSQIIHGTIIFIEAKLSAISTADRMIIIILKNYYAQKKSIKKNSIL